MVRGEQYSLGADHWGDRERVGMAIMIRRLLVLLVGLIVLTTLAGCTGNKSDPAASQSALAAARIQAASDCLDV